MTIISAIKPNFFKQAGFAHQNRTLKFFSPGRPEIAIVNNSGLMFALTALKMHGKGAHKNLKVIVPPYWMDKTHSDYDGLDWGQTKQALPRFIQEEFSKIYPDQPSDKLISWKQYKELREFVKADLKKRGIEIFSGLPRIVKTSTQYQIKINDERLTAPLETFFYNSFRVPRVKHEIHGFPERAHTDIYAFPRSALPSSFIIAGGGRSTLWLAQHFTDKQIACIKYNHMDYPLFEHEKLPSNLYNYNINDFMQNVSFRVVTMTNGIENLSTIVDLENKGRHFEGEFYAAIGAIPDFSVTQSVLSDNLLVYPYSESLDWIAPDDIPLGSLMEATLRWAYATNNLNWAFQTNCFHEAYFSQMMTEFLRRKQIFIDEQFFVNLKKAILQSHKQKRVFLQLSSDDEAIEIYRTCYIETYQNVQQANIIADLLKQHVIDMFKLYTDDEETILLKQAI